MKRTESEIRQDLIARAERQFGQIRTQELLGDLEQLSAELFRIDSFPIELDDEP